MKGVSKKLLREYFDYLPNGAFKQLRRRGNSAPGKIIKGSRHHSGYRVQKFLGTQYMFHQLIWCWHHGEYVLSIDHINRTKDDNRIENLRIANPSEQNFNTDLYKNNKSGYRGICKIKGTDSYRATVMIDQRRINLGESKDPIKLADRYARFVRKLRGKFYETR